MAKEDTFFDSWAKAEEGLEIGTADEIEAAVDIISTGSPGLDDILFCGGIPCGRLVQYYGPAGSGKTMMSMIAIAEAQRKSPTAKQLFLDAEGTFRPDWAQKLGVDLKRVMHVAGPSASNGRKIFELMLGVPKKDKKNLPDGKSKEGFFDKVASGDLDFNLVVLDSLGAIIPPMEDTAEVGKQNMALLSRFLSTELKKVASEAQKSNVPVIFINHVRDVMDPFAGGSGYTFAGGNQLRHSMSVNIFFQPMTKKELVIFDENENKIGHTLKAKIEKNKFGPWPRDCLFRVKFDNGVVDQEGEWFDLAIQYGIIQRPTNSTYTMNDWKWVGREKAITVIQEGKNNELEVIKAAVIKARQEKVESRVTVKS